MTEEPPSEQPQITLIQKTWRGFLARRRTRVHVDPETGKPEDDEIVSTSFSRQHSQSRKLKHPPRTPPRGNSTKFEPKDVLPQSTKVSEKIPFLKSTDLEVVIDGAIGLPLTTTLARIRVELHMPTKEILEIKSSYAYSDYLSEHTSPQFACRMNWRGRVLHPTMTIVCRIETLESPSLEPRCIGICALRLCVDLLGMQPLSEVLSDGKPSCFFNAGQFMVPILFGTIPADIQFSTESKIQMACPHIDGAYMRMSINPGQQGDKNGDKTPSGSPYAAGRKIMAPSSSMRASNYHSSTMEFQRELNAATNAAIDPWSLPSRSVGAVLLKTYIASEKELSSPYLSIPEVLLNKFREGIVFESSEKQEVTNAIVRWSQQRFDENKEASESINHRYLLEYSDTSGANATLDMLYNMPDRQKLTQAAERAAHVTAMRSGLIRGWDSQLNYYKTIFRYLPGSIPSVSKDEEKDKSRDMRLVVDDASVRPVFESPEQCPAFCDDFSSTEGLRLGPHACLLVVVTAVDVLISRKLAAQRDKYSNSDMNASDKERDRDPSYLSPMNSKASIFSEDASTKLAEKKLKMSKLKGLKGIYVGAKDPKSTFWGILPLFARFPNPLLGNESVLSSSHPSSNIHESKSGNAVKRNISNVPPLKGERDPSDFTTQGTEAGVSNQPSSEDNNNPLGKDNLGMETNGLRESAFLSSLAASPMFVNSGTHQIPLFRGLPPEEMISAPDPMAWLVTRIYLQLSRGPVQSSGFSSSSLGFLLYPCLACSMPPDADVALAAGGNTQQHRLPVNATATSPTSGGDHKAGPKSDREKENSLKNMPVSRSSSAALQRMISSELNQMNTKGKKKKNKKSKNVDIVLSDGASAIIRIVDPRVKRLAHHHSAITPAIVNNSIPGSMGNSKITTMATAASVVRASLRVSQKNTNAGGGANSNGVGGAANMASPGGTENDGNGAGHYHHPLVDGTTHSVSPALLPVRNDILEEVLHLHAHSMHDKNSPMVLDAHKLRTLQQGFALKPGLFVKKKTVKSAIPETMDAYYLIQEINTKFYEVISS
jgi:hypothetical protein